MKYPLTLDALDVLAAIARKGSFAAAAQELFRVPSAVSYTVQKLEQDLDVVLFRKDGRKAVLTPAGQVLLAQGQELLAAAERVVVATKTTHSGWEPVFNIAVDSLLSFDVVLPLIARFYQIQPEIEVNLYEEVLGGAVESIISGRADLVIGVGEQPSTQPGLVVRAFGHIDWVFAVAPSHPLALSTPPITADLLEQQRFVVVRDSARQQAPQSRRLCGQRPVLSVPSIAEKIRAQCAGLGVGFLPAHRIEDELRRGLLVSLPLETAIPPEIISLAWKASNKGKVLHWFVEALLHGS